MLDSLLLNRPIPYFEYGETKMYNIIYESDKKSAPISCWPVEHLESLFLLYLGIYIAILAILYLATLAICHCAGWVFKQFLLNKTRLVHCD